MNFIHSSVKTFANIYAAKLGINKDILTKTLWGDYYYNSKTKRVMKGAQVINENDIIMQLPLSVFITNHKIAFIKRIKVKNHCLCNLCLTTYGPYMTPCFLKSKYR